MANKVTKDSNYFSVTVTEVESARTATSSKIKWSWKRLKGYFGYCNSNNALVVKKAESYYKHLGIPKTWKSEYGSLSSKLTDGEKHKVFDSWGSLYGYHVNSGEYEETIQIPRGNERVATKKVTVGIESDKNNKKKWEALATITLSTLQLAEPSNITWSLTVDPETENNRKIHISASFTNPSTFYTGYIYDADGNVLTSFTSSTSYDVAVTRDMFRKNKYFKLVIKGKDGKTYYTGDRSILIAPDGLGISFKQDNQAIEIDDGYLKNNNYKSIPEVWIKINNIWVQTTK